LKIPGKRKEEKIAAVTATAQKFEY